MAGLILFLLGITGLGSTVKYIPRPVIVGFTNGIAVLIASTQIKDFLDWQSTKCQANLLVEWKRSRPTSIRFRGERRC